ncbi:AraC family transcriptional regulator [Flavobacterium sp. NKUCC04_CG]|uniref:helix-turn-helix domain-containing protein n=1 Tax=Flavobacterium sp. NKUCC04_CG TaxID=2842121 RepID=UPI001C5AAF23|nr:helix-turn-helix domain-containing protein [Flavobacterium sp. NKUCC04_CG]MBW3519057.1 helix-turn-helix domain-containing protein [Flavobacterium sp. NKUCC04_CG]
MSCENLQETLSFYGVHCQEPYYISSENPISQFQKHPFRMDFYAICLCTRGSIQINVDSKQYRISAKGLLISAPSTVIRFLNSTKDFRMQLLFFDKNFLLKNITNPFFIEKLDLFQNTSFSVIQCSEINSNRLSKLFDYLLETARRTGHFIDDLVRTVIFNLLLELAQVVGGELESDRGSCNGNNLFLKFKQLVQEDVGGHKDVTYYAEQLFITNKYLIKVVKAASGKTPHQIIDEQLLKEAFVLLSNPELNFTAVAYQLNFSSVSAFGRFFRKYAACSPSQYRKQQHL